MAQKHEFKFQGSGVLARIDTIETKNKPITVLILDTDPDRESRYPQLVPIKVFGELAQEAQDWAPGTVLKIWGKVGGREWGGKVYGDITADKVEVVIKGVQKSSAQTSLPPPDDSDVPF